MKEGARVVQKKNTQNINPNTRYLQNMRTSKVMVESPKIAMQS